jgi:redox-sensitive bicupin YhaK (pirin superfamily)
LHLFDGDQVSVDGVVLERGQAVRLDPAEPAGLENRGEPAEFLMLQGRPIGAPVFQMGPFVMNSPEELRQAVTDYHRTQFGGWPWTRPDPVHARTEGRFALHADGRVEHRDRQPV